MKLSLPILIASLLLLSPSFSFGQDPLFNMAEIRDESTLKVEVIEDWHPVDGEVPSRQKLVTINVGEVWPGQDYRVPVRMIVPVDGKATGFHLTGGHAPNEIENDIRLKPYENELIVGGVGLVYTLVQNPGMYGEKELGDEMNRRFIETLNPHYSIQYWGWPATIMRAATAAYAESSYFEKGKIAVSGGSKNGASPSVSLIWDERITAQHAFVSPIWDSPLRLCDRIAWDLLEEEHKNNHFFLGGTYGPIYNREALKAGHSWEELQALAKSLANQIFISRNLEQLDRRNVEFLFHPGTHDFVAFDLPWGGAHFPQIPVYLEANTGHGYMEGLPVGEKRQQNLPAFLLGHYFDHTDSLLEPPVLSFERDGPPSHVPVKFKPGSGEGSGRIFWMYNRAPEGSVEYLEELFPDDQWKDMVFDASKEGWTSTIELREGISTIDFFTTHGKTVERRSKNYQTYISSPYTRIPISL